MPSSCEFLLNKTNAVYFSGETIEGSIVLTTTSPKHVRDVSIIFKGEGKVRLEISRSSSDLMYRRPAVFKSYELYIDKCLHVEGERTLPPGTQTYIFSIQLPRSLPTSVEGRYGHIRYELTLKLNRDVRFDNVFSKPITVIKSVDLNLTPSYRLPIECEEITYTRFCTCSSGKLFYKFGIPFGGYTSGQTLKYYLDIQNQTMSDIFGYSIEFYKKMTFTAHTPQHRIREETTNLYDKRFQNTCLRYTNRKLKGQFIIPATSPSTHNPGIIAVEYFLKVTMHLGICDNDSELTLPIFIGTVPLVESYVPTNVTTHLIEVSQTSAPSLPLYEDDDDDEIGNDLPPNYGDLEPPTFEEVMRSNSPFIDTDIDERHRNINFRPLYPMYSHTDE